MVVSLKNAPLQLGVVTHNGESMLHFYGDILGLSKVGEIPFPDLGTLHKLQCGSNLIKLLVLEKPAQNELVRGDFTASTGYRYCALDLENLDETLAHCREKGVTVVADVRELRPGVRVAVVEDPDGNMIEFFEEQDA